MISRRGMLGGLLALAAPAIIRTPGLIMPIKPIVMPDEEVTGFGLPPLKRAGEHEHFDVIGFDEYGRLTVDRIAVLGASLQQNRAIATAKVLNRWPT